MYVCMYPSVCLSVGFLVLAENQVLKQATQAKVYICSEMNFGYKALFESYGVKFCSRVMA